MTMKRIVLASIIAGVIVSLVTLTGAQSNLPNPHLVISSPLDGTWLVNVTIPDVPPFPSIFTFAADGRLVVTTPTPAASPTGVVVDTNGAGEWIRAGDRQFAYTFVIFESDLKGTFLGTLKVRGTITLNDKSDGFSGPAFAEISDPNGKMLFGFPATTQATRLRVEPLP